MACRNGRLQPIRAKPAPAGFGLCQRRKATLDKQVIPTAAVLLHQEDGLAAGAHACTQARGLKLHQRKQAKHFRLARHEPRQDAAQALRFFT